MWFLLGETGETGETGRYVFLLLMSLVLCTQMKSLIRGDMLYIELSKTDHPAPMSRKGLYVSLLGGILNSFPTVTQNIRAMCPMFFHFPAPTRTLGLS